MCGRFYVNTADPVIEPFFRPDQWILPGTEGYADTYESLCSAGEIYPDNAVPVLTMHTGELRPMLLGWGFPKWTGKGVQFNAKSETAHELKSFKESLTRWRVVVPTNGFYEWRKEEGLTKKVKYLFSDANDPVLYIAAIAGIFQRAASPVKERFCILTRPSKGSIVEAYHDRMPVILRKDEMVPWMAGPDYAKYLTADPPPLSTTPA